MKLELKLKRSIFTDQSTIGMLWKGSQFLCYTLEDTIRDEKIMHETAIPTGTYQVRMTYSNRFKKIMPQLMDVPKFSGIRIHGGNTKDDTSGCILLGTHKAENKIWGCAPALDKVYSLIAAAEINGGTFLTIE